MTDSSAPEQVASSLTPMQQALLDRADSIFASIGQTVHNASNLATQQIPDIAVQYIAYGRATASAFEIVLLLFMGLSWWLFWNVATSNTFKLPNDSDDDPHGARIASWIIGGALGLISVIVMLCSLSNLIMVWTAPKVWLLRETIDLVKSVHQS